MSIIYKASDGSRWTITFEPQPPPDPPPKDWLWFSDTHVDDSGTAGNEEEARKAIEAWIEENPDG